MYFESLLVSNVAFQVIGIKATEFRLGNTPAAFRQDGGLKIKFIMTIASYAAIIASFFIMPWYAVIGYMVLGVILAVLLRSFLSFLNENAFVALGCCGLTVITLGLIVMGLFGDR